MVTSTDGVRAHTHTLFCRDEEFFAGCFSINVSEWVSYSSFSGRNLIATLACSVVLLVPNYAQSKLSVGSSCTHTHKEVSTRTFRATRCVLYKSCSKRTELAHSAHSRAQSPHCESSASSACYRSHVSGSQKNGNMTAHVEFTKPSKNYRYRLLQILLLYTQRWYTLGLG